VPRKAISKTVAEIIKRPRNDPNKPFN
jgi:hypothetical protein